MSTSITPLQSFETLRAEMEEPWLTQVFLQPREYGQMMGPYSNLIMGEDGSGKTAIELQLKEFAAQESSRLLFVPWQLQLSSDSYSSEQVAGIFISQVMNSLAFALLQRIVCTPLIYSSAPSWTKEFVLWFVQNFLQDDREYILSRLGKDATLDGLNTASHLLSDVPRLSFPHPPSSASLLSHLTENVLDLGLEGIWVFLDGLDILFRNSPDRLRHFLFDFLSTLEYFENPALVFKMIVSRELGIYLQTARSVVTRRVRTYSLRWQDDELVQIVEKRLEFTFGSKGLTLNRICEDKTWIEWVKQYAGDSPRGWLDLMRPILAAYLQKDEPLSHLEWMDIYRQSPPPLRLDLEENRVFLGWNELPVTGISYNLLRYLYENRHRPCTKSELYFRAHKGLDNEPRELDDPGWEDTASWEGPLDTALYRLRQVVEWDKRKDASPLYIVSERGRGQIRLENIM